MRDDNHAGTGCRALLFLTDAEMAEPPISQYNESMGHHDSNIVPEAASTESNTHEPTHVSQRVSPFSAAGSI